MQRFIRFALITLIFFSTSSFAADNFNGTLEKVDSDTVKIISQNETTYDIADLVSNRDYLVSEKAQAVNSFDNRIAELDARIQEAALLGVE